MMNPLLGVAKATSPHNFDRDSNKNNSKSSVGNFGFFLKPSFVSYLLKYTKDISKSVSNILFNTLLLRFFRWYDEIHVNSITKETRPTKLVRLT